VFWTVASQANLLKGEIKNLSIDHHGRLMLGPGQELVYESTAPFLWSMVSAPDGMFYVGSGNEGKVFKFDSNGKGALFFDANELEVHALALSPKGDLYVGTSPDGRVYRIDATGTGETFFDPEDKYIWALAFDRQGNLFVGTGDKGTVYRVTPDRGPSVFYKTMTTHAVALALEPSGNWLVGTESPGKLFRVDRAGKGFVLLDSTFQEIHAIRLDEKGAIYAAALSGRPTTEARPPEPPRPETTTRAPSAGPVPVVTTEVTSVTVVDPAAGQTLTTTAREDRRNSRGAVYRIAPDGAWDILWESRDDSPYDVSFDRDGALLVGTGRGGKIYRLSGAPLAPTLLAQADAQQITAFLRDAKGVHYYSTANPGKVFRLSADRADRGTYESEVRDAQTVAGWGVLSWKATTEAGGRLEIYTRSGNTPTPDATWSGWEGPYKVAEGDPIVSPKARYLQWKAELSGRQGNPVLTSVTAAYLPKNARPQVTSITVHPPGTVFQKPYPTGDPDIAGLEEQPSERRQASPAGTGGGPSAALGGSLALGRRAYQKGLQTFVWRAQDDDNDELTYEIHYRREGETTWKALKSDLTETIFVWDTTSVPNGTYLIKIGASDSPSNAPAAALIGELESSAFDIDNGPPVIRVTDVRAGPRPTLVFEVRDDQSPVQRVEYSIDAERWKPVYPKDGISDSRFEEFELVLEGDAAIAGVIIRAVDASNNIATSRGNPRPAQPR
jgi:outer membrane protein assembly factor BamB